MSEKFSMEVWKFLSSQMTVEEKKKLIKDKDIQIPGFHGSLIKSRKQWDVAIKLFETELKKTKVQKELILYYLEKIAGEYEERNKEIDDSDEDNEELDTELEDQFEILRAMSMEEVMKEIEKDCSFEEMLIRLIVAGDKEKANELVEKLPETVKQPENRGIAEKRFEHSESSDGEKHLRELEKKLKSMEASERKARKRIGSLEKKYTEMVEKKNSDIRNLEKKVSELKTIQESLNASRKDSEKLAAENKSLLERNRQLLNEKHELEEARAMLQVKVKQTHSVALGEQLNISSLAYADGEVKTVLAFGDVPITVYKHPHLNVRTFSGNYASYSFAESYDEYWYINDKLSPKMKKDLRRNAHAANVNWIRMDYSDLFSIGKEVMA